MQCQLKRIRKAAPARRYTRYNKHMQKELIFIGLGRMGGAMTAHLVEQGYTIHGFDVDAAIRETAEAAGVTVYNTLAGAVAAIEKPRVVWLMIPSRFVDDSLAELRPLLQAGDTIIDGGNSFFQDTIRRHTDLTAAGINYIDVGTSGGVSGARHGASLMVGGEREHVQPYEELFQALALPDGYGHVGGPGAGHFVKMVHNAIEYGMMGAIAEGLNVLHEHEVGMMLNLQEVLKPYQHGSIIASSLMDWMANAFQTKGYLEAIAGEVPKGETEMEMEYVTTNETTPVITAALHERQQTRTEPSFTGTLIAAMRNQFGGHAVITPAEETTKEKQT